MSILNLTVSPDSYQFATHEFTSLCDTLSSVDRVTMITPIASINDVALNPDTGKTTQGYTYSDVALLQLSALLAPGLAYVINDLSGQWRKPGEDKRFNSGELAVEIFNRTLKLRLDRKVIGLQLVRNTHTKTIDGLVGMRYRYLANSDFLERTTQLFNGSSTRFFEACLYGRQLCVRYIHHNTERDYDILGDAYAPGFHFANAEIAGFSIRAASLLIKRAQGYCALGQFTGKHGARLIHTGRNFDRNLQRLLTLMSDKLPRQTDLAEDIRELETTSLKLGTPYHQKRLRQLASLLARRKLTLQFARRVVASAANRGRSETDSLVDEIEADKKLILSNRTGYDLFVALIREARQLPIIQREIAEQTAYSMLTGKIHL